MDELLTEEELGDGEVRRVGGDAGGEGGLGEGAPRSAIEAARGEEHWFRRYPQHFHEMTRLAAGLNAGLIATDGLAALHESMRFVHQGAEGPIMDAIDVPSAHYFKSVTIGGTGRFAGAGLTLHENDTAVQGSQLDRLLDRWSDDGTAEPSAVEALRMLNERPELLDLRGQTFVLLGAGAEMGPYSALLSWGAHVVAADLPGGAAWRGLIDIARQSPGRLTLPVRHPLGTDPTDAEVAAAAGADVITEAPELTQWLLELDGPLTVGDYVYAPGALHVRISTAVDAILATLVDRRNDVGLAYLATPTDVYAVPSEVVTASMDAYASSGRLVDPGLLQGIELAVFREALERGDFTIGAGNGHDRLIIALGTAP